MRVATVTIGLSAFLALAACARESVPLPAPTPDCRYGGRTAVAVRSYQQPVETRLSAAATLDSAAAVLRRHGFTVLPRGAGEPVVTGALEHPLEGRTQRVVVRVDERAPGQVAFCAMWDPGRTRPNEIVTGVAFDMPELRFPKRIYDEITAAARGAP